MSILSKLRVKLAEGRRSEEKLYQQVNEEMEQGIIRDGLWTKAIAKSGGDEKRTKAHYITLRVQSLKDESEIEANISETIRNAKIKTADANLQNRIQNETKTQKQNTWKCTCGSVNSISVSNCTKCKKFKPPQSRW